MPRSPRLLVYVLGLLLLSHLWPSAPVRAHAFLEQSEPGAQAVLPAPPPEIALTFREPLDPRGSSIRLLDATGKPVTDDKLSLRPGNPRVATLALPDLRPGEYLVQWDALSTVDGHEVRGAYRFTIGAGPGQGGPARQTVGREAGQGIGPTPVSTVWRWAGLLSALLLAGWQLLRLGLRGRSGLGAPLFLPLLASWQAIYWLTVWRGLFLPGGGGPRLAAISAATAAVALAGGLVEWLSGRRVGARRPRTLDLLSALLGLLLLSGFASTGHAAASAAAPISAMTFDLMHLSAAALWLGAIAALATGQPVRRLTPWVAASLAVLILTGVFNAEDRGVRWAALWQDLYHRTLVVKVGLVAVMAALGASHAFVIAPRAAATRRRLWWGIVSLEGLTALAVVAATAVLTLAPPPRPSADGVRAAVGASLTLATHTGRTAVELQLDPNQAGDNRLQVRLEPGPDRPAPSDVRVRLLPQGEWVRLAPAGSREGALFAGRLSVPESGRYALEVAYRIGGKAETAQFRDWPAPVPGAGELLKRSEEAMAVLAAVRIHETLSDGVNTGRKWYWYQAPDRIKAQVIGAPSEMRIIGRDRWITSDGKRWEHDQLPEPVRVPDVSSYTANATETRLLGRETVDDRETFVVSFRYEQSLTRFKAWIDTATYRMLRLEMIYPSHYMTWLFDRFDAPVTIAPPAAGSAP